MLHILHTADLHLDSPFAGLSPEKACRRRQLHRQLPAIMAQLCRDHGCDLWLMAGDVFDGAHVCPETVEALQKAFALCGVPVFIAPGNHDPYTDQSPWATAVWPDNVHIFTGAMSRVELPKLACRVWGAAFQSKEASGLLQPVEKVPGLLDIGVFHGDPVNPGIYDYLPASVLETCNLDYLALGHIHKAAFSQKAGRTHYGWPGSAAARGFDELGRRQAFLVELNFDRCHTTSLPLPGITYEILRVQPGEQPEQAIREALAPFGADTVCRVILSGEAPPVDLRLLAKKLSGLCLSLELQDETTPPTDLWAGRGDRTLRGLALDTLYQAEDRELADLAARYLLAALEGRDGL